MARLGSVRKEPALGCQRDPLGDQARTQSENCKRKVPRGVVGTLSWGGLPGPYLCPSGGGEVAGGAWEVQGAGGIAR